MWISGLRILPGLAGLLLTCALPARAGERVSVAPPAAWSLDLRSTGYAYQSVAADGRRTDHLDLYQFYGGSVTGLAGGRLALKASGRQARASVAPEVGFERSVLYTAYLDARIVDGLRARVGRQFMQSGVAGLTLDGARLSYGEGRPWQLSAWGGAQAPFDGRYALGRWPQDRAAGARLAVSPGRAQRLAFSCAYRERGGSVAERPVGFEYAGSGGREVRLLGRAAYDLEAERWARLEAQARWRAASRLAVTLQAVDRFPSLDPASWLARFANLHRIRLARGSVRWEGRSLLGGELECVSSFVDTRRSSRLGVALLLPQGRIGYAVRLGGVTEERDLYGEAAWQARPWLRLEAQASYLVYALIADAPAAEERDLTTLLARAGVRVRPGLDLRVELQSLRDPLYSHDVRLLLGVDLAMARGTSPYGLDGGGWFR